MAPNSEDSRRNIESLGWTDETLTKEKQRPPVYNPEDYALSLRKWGKKCSSNSLYNNPESSNGEKTRPESLNRDYRNLMLTSSAEMTLRQFSTVTELLAKLKIDLRLSYPSFVQEFVSDPLDGLTLLLEVLRSIQLSQSNNVPGPGPGPTHANVTAKISPAIQRRAHLDELSCLQCILYCCIRYTESIRKLTASSTGLFTLSVCIMSNVNKSRIIALQLLTKSCEPANAAVSEALSTLRLRFGEPVRFRFLVGMLSSAAGSSQGELLISGLRFINTFLKTSGSVQKQLYVQAELEQAGFDVATLKKNVSFNSTFAEQIFNELDTWHKNHVDAEYLTMRLDDLEHENDSLRDKVLLLERKVQILQEEKGILVSLEQCLKEKCSELQDEVMSLRSSSKTPKNDSSSIEKDISRCTPEDEGISSSERSISPGDSPSCQRERESSVYEVYSLQNQHIEQEHADDEETTIDEVVEELHNIVNDVESELNSKNEIQMRVDSNVTYETEIVPTNLHPHPPRKSRSLVHLFFPADCDDCYRNETFFETPSLNQYASDESSDSLLSASKCRLVDSMRKSKSLDRIDDGLDAIVDIVVTQGDDSYPKKPIYENPKMFLPNNSRNGSVHGATNSEGRYYFPRVQEKKANNSFHIKRGHGNAGMYSGQNFPVKGDFTAGSRNSSSKLTDYPSGLY